METIKETEEKTEEELNKEFNRLCLHLFYCHYKAVGDYDKNPEVVELLEKNDLYLRKLREFIIKEDEQVDETGKDPYSFLMAGKNDQKPTIYRGDIVNKIDMILNLRTKLSNEQVAKYTRYIRPFQLESIYGILVGYIKAIHECSYEKWVSRENVYTFINSFDNDFMFIFTTYVEMLRDSVTRKYNGYCDSDFVRNHYTEEDQIKFNLADYTLHYIKLAKGNKKPGFFRRERD